MKKKLQTIIWLTTAMATLALIFSSCRKSPPEQLTTDINKIIAAQQYSNSELVQLIKKNDPPLSDRELLGVLISASPLDDNIIKEVLKRGQPPAKAPVSDETLQMILLRNLPLSDHIYNEVRKYRNGHVFNSDLINRLQASSLPDMLLDDANFLMEAALNLKYGDAHAAFDSIRPVTHTFQVPGKLNSGQYFLMSHDFMAAVDDMDLQCKMDSSGICGCFSQKIRGIDLNITTETEPATGDKIFNIDLITFLAVQTVDLEKALSINEFCEPNDVAYSFSITYDCTPINQNITYPTCRSWLNYIMSAPIKHQSDCQTLYACGDFFTDMQPTHYINNDGSLCQYFINIFYNYWQGHDFCISPQELNSKSQLTFMVINSPQHKPTGYQPAIIVNKPMPANAFCQGNHMYYDAEVYYARCGNFN